MPKIKNVSRETIRKPQSQASKDIKRINTNIKALGVKSGTDSLVYKQAVRELKETFGSDVKVTASGYYAVSNTKKTQARTEDIERILTSYKTSIKGRQEHAKQSLKARGKEKPNREDIYDHVKLLAKEERAIEYLREQGYTDITQNMINERVELDDALDWGLENTQEWYKWNNTKADVKNTRKLLKLKGRRKSQEEIDEITENMLIMYREHLANQEHYRQFVEGFSGGFTMEQSNDNIFSS